MVEEGGIKEATVMRMVEDGSGKMIREGAIMSMMLLQAICAFESHLSWREGWPSVWFVSTGSNRLLLLGIATLATR